MSDIFLSYAREDLVRVRPLVSALESCGWSVWWDNVIRPGQTFDRAIEQALTNSRCVIVAWSQASVTSDWVRVEAEVGRRRKVLVPVLLDEPISIPLVFSLIHAARLLDWHGDTAAPEFQGLVQAVQALLGTPPREDTAESSGVTPAQQPRLETNTPPDQLALSGTSQDTLPLRAGSFVPSRQPRVRWFRVVGAMSLVGCTVFWISSSTIDDLPQSLKEKAPVEALKENGNCVDFNFPLQTDNTTIDSIHLVRVLRHNAPVFQTPASAEMASHLPFGEPLEPVRVDEASGRGRIQMRRISGDRKPLGWMQREDLLCRSTPLRNASGWEHKVFIKSIPPGKASGFVQYAVAYPDPQATDCAPTCIRLIHFGPYFVFAEDPLGKRNLLAEQPSLDVSTALLGWVDVDAVVPLNTTVGLRPDDQKGTRIAISSTLESNTIGNAQAITVFGGKEWYTYPMRLHMLGRLTHQGKEYLRVVVPDTRFGPVENVWNVTGNTIGYTTVSEPWVQELWITSTDLDRWLVFVKQLVEAMDAMGTRFSEQQEQFAKVLAEKVQQMVSKPPLVETGQTLEEYVKRKSGLPVRSFSPLLQYELAEVRDMLPCELRRLSAWIRSAHNILRQVRGDGTLQPVFIKKEYAAEQCPKVSDKGKKIPYITLQAPKKLGPDDSYRYDYAFRGETRYWLPEEFFP